MVWLLAISRLVARLFRPTDKPRRPRLVALPVRPLRRRVIDA